jgi:hypothetical protein
MRAAWQRLGQLIDTIAGSRLFKPVVFVACAWPLAILSSKTWQLFYADNPTRSARTRPKSSCTRPARPRCCCSCCR